MTERRFAAWAVAAGLTCGPAWAAEEPSAAEAKYRAAVAAATQAHDEAIAAAETDYLAGLKDELAVETQRGNLDAALALRDKVAKLDVKLQAGGPLPKRLAGTSWKNSNGATFEWKEDGTFLHNGTAKTCTPLDSQRLAIFFGTANVSVLVFDAKLTSFEQFVAEGNKAKPTYTGKRTAEPTAKEKK